MQMLSHVKDAWNVNCKPDSYGRKDLELWEV